MYNSGFPLVIPKHNYCIGHSDCDYCAFVLCTFLHIIFNPKNEQHSFVVMIILKTSKHVVVFFNSVKSSSFIMRQIIKSS